MSAGKGPDREERKDAAIVDNLLEDLFFGEPGSKGNPSAPLATPKKQPRRSASVPKPISQPRPSAGVASAAQPDGKARMGTWGRVSLGVVMAVSMLQWPYGHSCGFKLGLYMTAVAMLLVTATWSSAFSWRHRMPIAHSVSLMLLLWGFVLVAGQVLPRVGYAQDLATWRCVATPEPVAPAIVPSVSPESDAVAGPAISVEETRPTVPDSGG